LLWICLSGLLSGCGTETIKVTDGALVDSVDYLWLTSNRSKARAVFSPNDEKVTLSVNFSYNFRAAYEWYRVEWIDPNGKPYKVISTRTEYGSHRDLQAHIKIKGQMAAELPGLWRVRLYHLNKDGSIDRLLFARLFRISDTPIMPQPTLSTTTPEQTVVSATAEQSATPTEPIKTTRLSTPLAAESGIAEATLTVKHNDGTQVEPVESDPAIDLNGNSKGIRLGCPPLYYPPDEGCVEEAPEE
jgi:hypothetical protein